MMTLNAKDAASKSLLGRWQLNEGKGKVALDSSKSDNTGVFGGNLQWTDECQAKPVVTNPKEQPEGCKISTGLIVYHFPLTSTTMEVKTTKFTKNAIKDFGKLKAAMQKPSPKGYCEKSVQHMKSVSNRKLCGGSNARNIGYYFRTTFPVGTNGLKYSFKTPTDFGYGGLVMLDGKIMKQERNGIWQGGKSTKLDFTIELSSGMHVLEYYGSENCCDGVTSW